MSDDGDGIDLELNSAENEGENSDSNRFKCNFSSDNISYSMGLSSEYCNNGGANTNNLGLNLLQNFDESNLFHCDIANVEIFEWVRQRSDSVSSADLECMRIDCNEAVITTSELTSINENVKELDNPLSPAVSCNLVIHRSNSGINSSLLDELCIQSEEQQLIKSDSLINDVCQLTVPPKELIKSYNVIDVQSSILKTSNALYTKVGLPENPNALKHEDLTNLSDLERNKLNILKNSLPYVKVPKKCILAGKILKKDAISILSNKSQSILDQSNYGILPKEKTDNSEVSTHNDFTSEMLCESDIVNHDMQLLLSEDRIKSPLIDENLNFNNENTEVRNSSLPQNKSATSIKSEHKDNESRILSDNNLKSLEKENTKLVNNSQSPCVSNLKEKSKTIVAISTNKLEDTTEISIKTEDGEEVYKGKSSELLKAINSPNLVLRFDPSVQDKLNVQLTNLSDDEEPITEALKSLGITNDQFDVYEITKGQQRCWYCPVSGDCDIIFNKLSSLKIHILSHYKLRPFKCEFPGCEWSFYTNFKLKRHKETHLKNKKFKCTAENCNRSFTTIYNLNTHLKLHERPPVLFCSVKDCGKAFQTRRNLDAHLKEHGAEHAPYMCGHEGCDKRYYSLCALNSHSRTHMHNIDDLKCEFCNKIFDKPCRLKAHLRSHTGVKPFKCNYEGCDWAFPTSSKLIRHQSKHTQERRFICSFCNKGFLRSEHLKEHSLKHILNRALFVCPYEGCDQQYSTKPSLYVHLKKHRKKDEEITNTINNQSSNDADLVSINSAKLFCPVKDCELKFSSKYDKTTHIRSSHEFRDISHDNFDVIYLNPDCIKVLNDGNNYNIISVDGVQIKNESSINDVDLNNDVQEVIIGLPEYINISTVTDLASFNEMENDNPELSEIIQDSLNEVSCSNISLNNCYSLINTATDIGSARTGLTYQDVLSERDLRKYLKKPLIPSKKKEFSKSENMLKDSNLVVSSDVLNSGLLGTSQENLTRGLIFQEDNIVEESDLYRSVSDETDNNMEMNPGELLHVYSADSCGVRNSDFEQSTINLSHLE